MANSSADRSPLSPQVGKAITRERFPEPVIRQSAADDARVGAQVILARVQSEPAFRVALTADPVGALQAAGFTLEDAREFGQELDVSDIDGHMKCTYTCDRYSCWITQCGNVPLTN